MQIIAKVLDLEVTQRDLDRESSKISTTDLKTDAKLALKRIIDRCLLYYKALESGLTVTDAEYDNALLELIEQEEPLGLSSEAIKDLSAREMETLLKRQIVIKKYIQTLCPNEMPITSQKLHEFYEESRDIFQSPARVRCSHILIKGTGEESEHKARKLRKLITNADDFNRFSKDYSDCPSNAACGDIGWFHKGKMIPEIDEVAFNMQIGEISQPFKSAYGFHILMLTDRKDHQAIPFEDIKDSLYARLQQIEKEYVLTRLVSDLRKEYASQISILLPELA